MCIQRMIFLSVDAFMAKLYALKNLLQIAIKLKPGQDGFGKRGKIVGE